MSKMPFSKIEVRSSKIHGYGVFATGFISKGDLAVPWKKTKEISEVELSLLGDVEKTYIERKGNRIFLVGEPERYVNHSCNANTSPGDLGDIANRDIEPEEEVTANYSFFFIPNGPFSCTCNSSNCKQTITGTI